MTAPLHVAIIMDGNGRWAKARMLPRIAGHRRGVEAVRRVVRAAADLNIGTLTLYAFSSENWRRPADEVSDLMGLLRRFIQSDIDELVGEGVRLAVIGDYRALAPDLVALIDDAIARTLANDGPLLVIALNYGAQAEIAATARRLARQVASGELAAEAIDERVFEGALPSGGLPPVDLLIRTSGEQRLSNFLLWQAAYAELLFVDTLWPDFGPDELAGAVRAFGARQRRFGGL
ncbi:undecaprenyl diphosphate synthase [Sphingomonas guangdongensis]|uniref:Isoprenyl transferase n=1 Tax=Sphingomonas guangdongensis TaxID=1141890 RepID=A0A285R249_9SPHN|nr:undecaprenyl diphosphate synthase [Sphingomonas guangdongensis]